VWDFPHNHSAGNTTELNNFLIEDISAISHGDGIRTNGNNTIVDGTYVADIYDDCIENVKSGNLLVTDSFLDGCCVTFSAKDQTATRAVIICSKFDTH